MPRRSVLSAVEKEFLLAFPTDEVQRVRLYTLSSQDLGLIRERRGEANRLGFAVQLCAMRYPGVALAAEDAPPLWLLKCLARQLDVSPECWSDYSHREATRRVHALALQSLYGFASFSRTHVRPTVEALRRVAFGSDQGLIVATALVDHLRGQRILIPPIAVIERLCAQAITQGERQIYATLCELLTPQHDLKLEELLHVPQGGQLTRLRWLCGPPGAANPKQILEHIERLNLLTSLDLPSGIGDEVPRHRLLKMARQGLAMTPTDLARFEEKRRLATLVAVVLQTHATLLDETVELHDRVLGAAFNQAKRNQEHHWGQSGKAINDKVRLYARIGQTLLDARERGHDAYAAIESVLSWEAFSHSVKEAEQLAQPIEFDALPRLIDSYATIRRYAPAWLEALPLSGPRQPGTHGRCGAPTRLEPAGCA